MTPSEFRKANPGLGDTALTLAYALHNPSPQLLGWDVSSGPDLSVYVGGKVVDGQVVVERSLAVVPKPQR